jgi:hypothetical protein
MSGLAQGKVYKYDLKGNFIDEYIGVREAAFLNNTHHSNIGSCIKGEITHCSNFIYTKKYYIKLPDLFLNKKFHNVNRNAYMKKIYEYDLKGNYKRTLKNYKEIATTKNECGAILEHLKNELKIYNNKIYKFDYYEKLPKEILDIHFIKQTKYINISQYDLKGNYIETFNNKNDLCDKINISKMSVYKSIDEKKSTKGFYFTLYKIKKLNLNEFKICGI